MLLPAVTNAQVPSSMRVGYEQQDSNFMQFDGQYYRGVDFDYLEMLSNYLNTRFTYEEGTETENYQRLLNGELDAVLVQDTHSWRDHESPNLLLPSSDLVSIPLGQQLGWLVVRQDHVGWDRDIQLANDEMVGVNPLLRSVLLREYDWGMQQPLELTKEEKAYLQAHPDINVLVSTNLPPYSWVQDGEVKGVVAEIMKRVGNDLGVKFHFIPVDAPEDPQQEMANAQADIFANVYLDAGWAAQNNVRLTFPFIRLSYVEVTAKGKRVDKPVVACPRGRRYVDTFLKKKFPEAQLKYFDTVEDCLDAVNDGKVDATYVLSITAQYYIEHNNLVHVHTDSAVDFAHFVSMAVSDDEDPVLVRILNKEIMHLNQMEIDGIVEQEIYAAEAQNGWRAFIYRNPILGLLAVGVPALLVIAALLFYLQQRRKHENELYHEAHFVNGMEVHNEHWFRENLPRLLQEHSDEVHAGHLFVVVMSVKNFAFLRDYYGKNRFDAMIEKVLRQKFSSDSTFIAYGMSSEITQLFALCRKTKNNSVADTIDYISDLVNEVQFSKKFFNSVNFYVGAYEIPKDTENADASCLDSAMLAYNNLLGTNQSLGIYNQKLQDKEIHRNNIERYMDKALQAEEFQVYLQPKYNIAQQAVFSAESLVRWDSPELGFMMPGAFIPIFERNGFILQFDYYMLEHVCRHIRERLDKHLPVIPIAVNQSGLHMMEDNYLKNMQTIVKHYHLPKGLVELEITETAFSQSPESTRIVQELKNMGFRLAMDDFCTGYSSISMLQHLPMDVMKVDRSLLLDAEKSPRALTILKDVVQMGRDLHMLVLTEGVETKEQEQLLLAQGCEYAQGFLFGKPMTIADFEKFMACHNVREIDY